MSFFNLTFMEWILILIVLVLLFYYLITKNNDFFLKRGVKFIKPFPLFGNFASTVFRQTSFPQMFLDIYFKYPTEKIIGVFQFLTPIYLIRDPELIKQITVKDFDHFVNHLQHIDENIDPMFGRGVFSMRDEKWRNMRATLSPAFTSSKMKQMCSLMIECSKETVKYIKNCASNQPIQMEMKDIYTRFTNDVIATCAFGIKTDSLNEKENEFYVKGKKLTTLTTIQNMKFFAYSAFPKIMKFFKLTLFPTNLTCFYRDLIHGAIKYRKENNIIRPDMINLLMQAQRGSLKHDESDKKSEQNDGFATVEESDVGKSNKTLPKWTDDDLTAQCILFFMAGYSSVAHLLSFLSYELAANLDIQQKLLNEIDSVKAELNGKPVTYDILQKMKYLDMTISETLRRWSAAIILDRRCNKTTTLKIDDNRTIQINKGDGIWYPVFSIHLDPQYYPDPEKFDPERFSDENKHKIQPFTFMPFGVGPRNCIASRFALIEAKALVFELLSELTIEMSTKSEYPIVLAKKTFQLEARNGYWLQFRKREK